MVRFFDQVKIFVHHNEQVVDKESSELYAVINLILVDE